MPVQEATSADGSAHPASKHFTDFSNPLGYNGKVSERHAIEKIIDSHFLHQKPLMKESMAQLGGSIISIDCTVKNVNRIYVYIDGTHFKPWAGMTAIQNEFNEIIWWRMVTVVDSYTEIKPHLIALKERLERMQGPDGLNQSNLC